MKVEQDVLKLIKELNEHEAEAIKLRQALCDKFCDEFDGCYIGDFFVVDSRKGESRTTANGVTSIQATKATPEAALTTMPSKGRRSISP